MRSTKRCLQKMIGRASFTRDELLTAVVEIEAVINSRPLSYVSAMDVEKPLTPSHLLVGRRILSLPDYLGHMCEPSDKDFEVSASQLTKRMKLLGRRSEYLSELRVIVTGLRMRGILTLLQVKWLLYTMIPYHADYGNWDGSRK